MIKNTINLINNNNYILPNISIFYTLLFCIGLFSLIFNKKNYLISIMAIEIMMLSLSLLFILFSIYLDDTIGQVFVIFILTISAAESVIGLALIITYFKINDCITFKKIKTKF